EPPVVFPPAAVWKRLSDDRKARFDYSGFGPNMPRRGIELRAILAQPITKFGGFDDPRTTLEEALSQLEKRYGVKFDVDEPAFKAEGVMDVMKTEIAQPTPIPALDQTTLGTILKKLLARVAAPSGATYIIRGDSVEITTGALAQAEKAIRVYPVADLVIPI